MTRALLATLGFAIWLMLAAGCVGWLLIGMNEATR